MKYVALDSAPLGLLTQQKGVVGAEECRAWFSRLKARGVQFLLPEIIDYELRRELIRAGKKKSVDALDLLRKNPSVHFLVINSAALRLAANLWATARRQGQPTADAHALDIDVILAAQILDAGLPADNFVVATSNVRHLSQFVPAAPWSDVD